MQAESDDSGEARARALPSTIGCRWIRWIGSRSARSYEASRFATTSTRKLELSQSRSTDHTLAGD
eukprot:6216886-Prymnesium_polylepis.2